MNSPGYRRDRGFYQFSWRRLLHSVTCFLGAFLVLAVFFVALILAESTFYGSSDKWVRDELDSGKIR